MEPWTWTGCSLQLLVRVGLTLTLGVLGGYQAQPSLLSNLSVTQREYTEHRQTINKLGAGQNVLAACTGTGKLWWDMRGTLAACNLSARRRMATSRALAATTRGRAAGQRLPAPAVPAGCTPAPHPPPLPSLPVHMMHSDSLAVPTPIQKTPASCYRVDGMLS